jgi:hypothetical protein
LEKLKIIMTATEKIAPSNKVLAGFTNNRTLIKPNPVRASVRINNVGATP